MNHVKTALGVLLIALLLSGSYLLDGSPTETDVAQASALDLQDAIADARSAKE